MHAYEYFLHTCKLNKNRTKKGIKRRDGVCGCSFVEPLKQETFETSLYIQTCA